MPNLKFYDLKGKKSFTTDDFKLKKKQTKKGIRHFATTKAPSGVKASVIVSKDFYEDNK